MAIYKIKFRNIPNQVIFDSDEYEKKLRRGMHASWFKEVSGWSGGIETIQKISMTDIALIKLLPIPQKEKSVY